MEIHFSKFLNTETGKKIMSILLGFGLASLFRKACKDRNCFIFKGPPLDEIKDNIYKYEKDCYTFNENLIKCGNKEKSIEFA